MPRKSPGGEHSVISGTAYIDPTAEVIGKVKIGKNVFVGPGAVIRADEAGSSISIEDNCNVQDRVIVHALENTSVLIKENTSLSHGCIIHGPCSIGKNCFIGFGSVVFSAKIGDGVYVKHLVVVENASIIPGRIVESHSLIDSDDAAKKLDYIGGKTRDFMKKVVDANLDLVRGYKNDRTLGDKRETYL